MTMNEQKMREAFESWTKRNLTGVNDQSFKRMPALDYLYDDGRIEALWQCWQAAPQYDLTAVGEAVAAAFRRQCIKMNIRPLPDIDIAGIVEVMRTGADHPTQQPESVNARLVQALEAVHAKFGSRPYGTGSYITKDIRDQVAQALAEAKAAPIAGQQDEWPNGATVKLRWVGSYSDEGTPGWAKRDEQGRLVSSVSLQLLDPNSWEVLEEHATPAAQEGGAA